jgi:predicted dienelactone hydrolase
MRSLFWLLLVPLAMTACSAQRPARHTEASAATVGWRAVPVDDPVQHAPIPVHVLYPACAPETLRHFDAYQLSVAPEAPVTGDRLPLVLISHGTGGSPWVYRDLAMALARAGFVVALVEHPGNNWHDDHLAGTIDNLEARPRHTRLVIDAAYADRLIGPHLAQGRVAIVGHSMGGYTALAAAGGRATAFPNEAPTGHARSVPSSADPRLRALVLLAPATVWFSTEAALADVALPILMLTAQKDDRTTARHAEIVLHGIRDRRKLDHRIVPGAGHFSFLSPFPPSMVGPDFAPAHDPPGFDRASFQIELAATITAFLRAEL